MQVVDNGSDSKDELADLQEKHDVLVVEKRALVDEMARKEKIWIEGTAAKSDADAEARLKGNELEEQQKVLLALHSEVAAMVLENTALKEKIEQLETTGKTNGAVDPEVKKQLATSQINMVCNGIELIATLIQLLAFAGKPRESEQRTIRSTKHVARPQVMLLDHATQTDTWVGRKKNKDLKKEVREIREKNVDAEAENKLLLNEMDKKDMLQTKQAAPEAGAHELAHLTDLEAKLAAANSEIVYLTDKVEISEQKSKQAKASFDRTTNPLSNDAVRLLYGASLCSSCWCVSGAVVP